MRGFLIILVGLPLAWSAAAGTVTGAAYYDGTVPGLKPVDMDSDPVCTAHYKDEEPPANEVLVLGEEQSLGNGLVEVIAGLPEDVEYDVPEEPVVLTQLGCRYSPRMLGVRAGQPLKVLNPDGTLHNVNAAPKKNPAFNRGMPANVKDFEVVFEEPEPIFAFRCNVHPWMLAYCAVLDHPYFAVSSAEKNGAFEIADLPPGKYTLRATHERLGTQEAEVEVPAEGDAAPVEFRFTRPGAK